MDANTVYEMVMGAITEDEASEEYAKIQDEFSEDSECDRLYGEIYEAKQHISQKLHKSGEEDPDVELIINHMFDICHIIGIKMFECLNMARKRYKKCIHIGSLQM